MVTAQSREKYQVDIEAGRHQWRSDEPVESGGDDTGPSPYELLLGALAACKIITVQMYAERKGWPLTGVRANLSRRKVPGTEIGEGGSSGPLDLIEVDIRFEGDLGSEQLQRLLEISERCPVHRTLTRGVLIRSDLAAVEVGFTQWNVRPTEIEQDG